MPAPRTKATGPRRRSVGAGGLAKPEEANIPQETHDKICELMTQCYDLNKRQNDYKKAYDARRQELYDLLKAHKRDSYRHVVDKVCYIASFGRSSKRVVDPAALREKVTDDVFMSCISAAVGLVQKFAGENVANEISTTEYGEENVSVKTEAVL